MYYYYKWSTVWVIRKKFDEDFVFGPFHCEEDADMVCNMLNKGSLTFKEDDSYAEEDTENTYTIY